jgi:hypothetical protein
MLMPVEALVQLELVLKQPREAAFHEAAESLTDKARARTLAAKYEEMMAAGAIKKCEAENNALAGVQHFEHIVKLDVGGVRVTTLLATLLRFPGTIIGCMFSGRHALPKGEDGYIFIDRDGKHFRHILNFLCSPEDYKVEVMGADARELRLECKYYGIYHLMFGTEKRLRYTNIVPDIWHGVMVTGSIDVLVDVAGVHTLLDSGEPIEYCPLCHYGFFNFGGYACYFEHFNDQSPTAAQVGV